MSSDHVFRVFVASPSDVQRERDILPAIVNELNRTLRALLRHQSVRLELLTWETRAFPAMGRPQQVINDQIGAFDIFVGLLWQRFGTPTGKADSGTEEEFRLAYQSWLDSGTPHILLYFNRAPITPPRRADDVQQLARIAEFRDEVSEKGLIWEYSGASHFADVVRPHLTEIVGVLLDRGATGATPEPGVSAAPPSPDAPEGALRVVIIDVGKEDGYHAKADRLAGMTGILIADLGPSRDGWRSATIQVDDPLFDGDDREYVFFQVRFDSLTDSP